jgi:hypothetical protein
MKPTELQDITFSDKPFFIPFQKNLIDEIGFEHWIIDNMKIKNKFIERIYFLKSKEKTIRGNHAHLNQFQILILVSGDASLILSDKNGTSTNWDLETAPVFIPENHWIELYMGENSNVLCLASSSYKDLKTLRDKNEFLLK